MTEDLVECIVHWLCAIDWKKLYVKRFSVRAMVTNDDAEVL